MNNEQSRNKAKEYFTWNDFDAAVVDLAREIRLLPKKPQSIYGVPRGGLVVAVALSHELEIPMILSEGDITDRTLVVDDISDTGKTLLRLPIGKAVVATIHRVPKTSRPPDIYVWDRAADWVVYPWEKE